MGRGVGKGVGMGGREGGGGGDILNTYLLILDTYLLRYYDTTKHLYNT